VDGAARRGDLPGDLGHHLPGPVVGVDEPGALAVHLVAAERVGDVGAGRPVVVLDQRVDLEAFDAAELGAGVVGHRVPVAGVGRVLVGAVPVAAGGQAEPAGGAGGLDYRICAGGGALHRAVGASCGS